MNRRCFVATVRRTGSNLAVRLGLVNEQCPFCNVHGHTHLNRFVNTLLHVNVCAECLDYTPIAFDAVKEIVKERLEKYNEMKNQAEQDR